MNRLTHPRNNGIKSGYWSPNKKDDLIERLAAYENTEFSPDQIEEMCDLYGEKCAELVQEQKKHRWIPVEERLPEESLDSVIGFDAYRSRCCFVQYYSGEWHMGNESIKIIAWMPLPGPYRKEER